MNHQKLNNAAAAYHGDRNDGDFREVYELLGAFRRQYLRKANGRYMNDIHSLIETFDTTLWKSLNAYDMSRDFLPFFSCNLKRANVSRIRKAGTEKIAKEVYDSVSEDGSSMLESIKSPECFEEFVQKKRDQRELISNLLASKDELAKRICSNYGMYDSDNALAKALGIHHTAVSRTFAKLRNRFDANRFGALSDYITA